MPNENPGAYNEANNRIREKQENEKVLVEKKKEEFEISKERLRKKKGLDVFQLKRKIETGQSLDSLKDSIKQAYNEGMISKDAFEKTMNALNQDKITTVFQGHLQIDPIKLPFSGNALARVLEEAKLGENVLVDIVGISYGFVIQGSAILVILAWKIFTDLLFLPRDIYKEMQK